MNELFYAVIISLQNRLLEFFLGQNCDERILVVGMAGVVCDHILFQIRPRTHQRTAIEKRAYRDNARVRLLRFSIAKFFLPLYFVFDPFDFVVDYAFVLINNKVFLKGGLIGV